MQTILSRVKRIDLDKLTEKDIVAMLEEKGIQKERAELLASCANGNGEFAEKLALDDGFVSFYNQVVGAFFDFKRKFSKSSYSN